MIHVCVHVCVCVCACLCVRVCVFVCAPAFFPIPSRISCPYQPHQHGRKGLGKILVRIRGRTWGSCVFVCVHLCVCVHFFSQAQEWRITLNIKLQPCSVAVAPNAFSSSHAL